MNNRPEICDRVSALRRWMAEHEMDAFLVPTLDPHNSEYLPAHWMSRQWVTGFTGSAGTALITRDEALMWTDSRYFLQGEEELAGTPYTLMREGEAGVPDLAAWLCAKGAEKPLRLGYDPALMTIGEYDTLAAATADKVTLCPAAQDPFETLWQDRPEVPHTPAELMPESLAGESAAAKLERIRAAIGSADALVMGDLSEIAWTLNLRAADIDYNPFMVAYLIVDRKGGWLFTDPRRFDASTRAYLDSLGITLRNYGAWADCLRSQTVTGLWQEVALCGTLPVCFVDVMRPLRAKTSVIASPVTMMRAIKNETEREGFREAMARDGVALVRWLRWMDENVVGRADNGHTELSVDERLTALRREDEACCDLSFPTIAGYAAHGAIVHYEATPETAAVLEPRSLLLVDSGAQYASGTTDITRTIALGETTAEERRVYTAVLRGHIALQQLHFPDGTLGIQLDTAARAPLWELGLDYGHGTGHGVGHRLGVHEGPHQIRKNLRGCTQVPFCEGMTVTDEPGVYIAGKFGVRIENVLLTRRADHEGFLCFEPLTLCPYDMRAVELSMLSASDRKWLNDYHAMVRERLMPRLTDEADRRWLEAATAPIALAD